MKKIIFSFVIYLLIFLGTIFILSDNATADPKHFNMFGVITFVTMLVYSMFGLLFYTIELYNYIKK